MSSQKFTCTHCGGEVFSRDQEVCLRCGAKLLGVICRACGRKLEGLHALNSGLCNQCRRGDAPIPNCPKCGHAGVKQPCVSCGFSTPLFLQGGNHIGAGGLLAILAFVFRSRPFIFWPCLAGIVLIAVAAPLIMWRAKRRHDVALSASTEPNTSATPTPNGLSDDDIRKAAERGQMIQAIKWYRALHDADLKEAKEAVASIAGRSL